jgi:hypothetical protein
VWGEVTSTMPSAILVWYFIAGTSSRRSVPGVAQNLNRAPPRPPRQ